MTSKDATYAWSVNRYCFGGLFSLVLLFGGFGAWSVMTSISGAIVMTGRVAVENNRQIVQHPDGGVVIEILVGEGDAVNAGDVLVRLDPSGLATRAEILRSQLFEIEARSSRLFAEQTWKTSSTNNVVDIEFSESIIFLATSSVKLANIIEGQRSLFAARSMSREYEEEQLRRRKYQIASQIDGIDAQAEALGLQLALIRQELSVQQSLKDRGLSQSSRVLALQREEAMMMGRDGEITANRAELTGRLTEIDLEILRIGTRIREEAITELRKLESTQIELVEEQKAIHERMSRLEIVAPVSGVVYDMQVFAVRSVIRPADSVLYVVPQDGQLVIRSRVDPTQVDNVYPGQKAHLRFSTFDNPITPDITGRVARLSPDAFTDNASGEIYYEVEVQPDLEEMDRLGGHVLLPGMPVETFLATGVKTPLAYLVKPFADYFTRAFKE